MAPEKAPAPTQLRDDLYFRVARYQKIWQKQTRVYAGISISFRVVLILATALEAAQKTAEGVWKFAGFNQFFLLLSIVVAVLTALDSWLKPREKWQGFLKVNEDALSILDEVRQAEERDKDALGSLRSRFEAVLENHRQHDVY
jgi:hypothetical protein